MEVIIELTMNDFFLFFCNNSDSKGCGHTDSTVKADGGLVRSEKVVPVRHDTSM